MGLYRKLGRREDAVFYAEKALRYITLADLTGTVGAATAMLNAATVYKAFGMAEKGIPLFAEAKTIYENLIATTVASPGFTTILRWLSSISNDLAKRATCIKRRLISF